MAQSAEGGGGSFTRAVNDVAKVVQKRLRITEAEAASLAQAYVEAAVAVAVRTSTDDSPPPGTVANNRLVLVERMAAALGRLPSSQEVAAVLRIPETTARSALSQVLATSDDAASVALKSVFSRAKHDGDVGGGGAVPDGKKWKFSTRADLTFAKRELERNGIKYVTHSSADGNYVLLIDPEFAP